MLTWDGSLLEDVTITEEQPIQHFKVYRLHLKDQTEKHFVIAIAYNPIAMIGEKIKPLFGIPHTGCHIIKYGGKKMIYPLFDYTVEAIEKNASLSASLVEMIQKLLVFRSIIGVSPNNFHNIRIRTSHSGFLYPVSYGDKYTIDKNKAIDRFDEKPFTSLVLEKWFSSRGETPDSVFEKMIATPFDSNSTNVINSLRTSIENIIRETDEEYLYLINGMYSKMMTRITN